MPEGGAGAESARGQTIPTPQQKKAAQAVSEVLKTGMARSKVQNNSLSVYVCGERWPAFFFVCGGVIFHWDLGLSLI